MQDDLSISNSSALTFSIKLSLQNVSSCTDFYVRIVVCDLYSSHAESG